METPNILRKRKSIGDTVLERNICFVDTPGYSMGLSRIEVMDLVLHYIGEQVQRSFSATPGEGDIVGLLSGNGGAQVDLVFYLIADGEFKTLVFMLLLTPDQVSSMRIFFTFRDSMF